MKLMWFSGAAKRFDDAGSTANPCDSVDNRGIRKVDNWRIVCSRKGTRHRPQLEVSLLYVNLVFSSESSSELLNCRKCSKKWWSGRIWIKAIAQTIYANSAKETSRRYLKYGRYLFCFEIRFSISQVIEKRRPAEWKRISGDDYLTLMLEDEELDEEQIKRREELEKSKQKMSNVLYSVCFQECQPTEAILLRTKAMCGTRDDGSLPNCTRNTWLSMITSTLSLAFLSQNSQFDCRKKLIDLSNQLKTVSWKIEVTSPGHLKKVDQTKISKKRDDQTPWSALFLLFIQFLIPESVFIYFLFTLKILNWKDQYLFCKLKRNFTKLHKSAESINGANGTNSAEDALSSLTESPEDPSRQWSDGPGRWLDFVTRPKDSQTPRWSQRSSRRPNASCRPIECLRRSDSRRTDGLRLL